MEELVRGNAARTPAKIRVRRIYLSLWGPVHPSVTSSLRRRRSTKKVAIICTSPRTRNDDWTLLRGRATDRTQIRPPRDSATAGRSRRIIPLNVGNANYARAHGTTSAAAALFHRGCSTNCLKIFFIDAISARKWESKLPPSRKEKKIQI